MIRTKSDILCLGMVTAVTGSLLSGAHIRNHLNKKHNYDLPLKDTRVLLSIAFWPVTLPYTIFNDFISKGYFNEFIYQDSSSQTYTSDHTKNNNAKM